MAKNGEDGSSVATFVVEFDRFGEDHIQVAPGVFIPVDEFIKDFEQYIKDYILTKIAKVFSQ